VMTWHRIEASRSRALVLEQAVQHLESQAPGYPECRRSCREVIRRLHLRSSTSSRS
jgi:hypothetical protein